MRNGWEVKRLSEAFDIKPPKNEARATLKNEDDVSFLPMEDLGISKKDINANKRKKLKEVIGAYTYFADNDVLLAKITPCFENGKIGIARDLINGVGFGSSEYIVFRSTGKVIPEYLFYFLAQEKFIGEGRANMTGAVGHKRVSKDFIDNYLLPYPKEHSEQKRIVEILDEAFAAIDKAKANVEKNLQNTKELFESYLKNIFTNQNDEWKNKRLGDICTIGDGNYSSKYPKASEFVSEGVPFLTATNLKNGTIVKEGIRFISEAQHRSLTKGHIKENDLVIVVRGSGTGNNSLVPKDYENSNLNSQLAYLRVDNSELDSRFLFCVFNSPQVQSVVLKEISGAAQPQLPNNKLLDIKVPIPSKSTQLKVVNDINRLKKETFRLEQIYIQKLLSLDELKKSILKKAFAGELTAKTFSIADED